MGMIPDLRDAMESLDRRVEARINNLSRRVPPTRYNFPLSRPRPICYDCGATGHFERSCPQREYHLTADQFIAGEPRQRLQPPRYQHNLEYQPRQGEIKPPEQQDNPLATADCDVSIASYDYVKIEEPKGATQNREKTVHPIRQTSLKREHPNSERGSRPMEVKLIFQKREMPGRGTEPINAQCRVIQQEVGEVLRAENTSPKVKSPATHASPQDPPQGEVPVVKSQSQPAASKPKQVIVNKSDDQCPQQNKVFPPQSLTKSNHPPVSDRNIRSYYGSGLARRTGFPLGPVM